MLLRVDAHVCEHGVVLSNPNVRKWIATVLLWWLLQVVVKAWVDLSRC